MDAENLKSLGWLLVWGALFFVMMRYGCGAHMWGRHEKRKQHSAAAGGETKDPVCGMSVSPEKAAAASVLKGSTYYFCSRSCRDKFEQTPDTYIAVVQQAH